jgi:hypothetical protein
MPPHPKDKPQYPHVVFSWTDGSVTRGFLTAQDEHGLYVSETQEWPYRDCVVGCKQRTCEHGPRFETKVYPTFTERVIGEPYVVTWNPVPIEGDPIDIAYGRPSGSIEAPFDRVD